MTVPQLAEAIRRARDYSGEPLEVVLMTRTVACPRCGRDRCQPLLAATSREFGARRCSACGCAFRVVVATSADLVQAIAEAAEFTAPPVASPPSDRRRHRRRRLPRAAAAGSADADDDLAELDQVPPTAAQREVDEREYAAAEALTPHP